MTTKMAPSAMPLNMFDGTMNSPASAIITVIPLNSTARLAVSPERTIASTFSTPLARSSRKRSTMNSV